ncbi:hypothetical protein NPIL_457071 [Nephila pilipes]|uniref:Uncharacterized protein n=1 Tax=Nephila pilipes TaxID=299642 RepID=A0A8X6P3E2_NEPPI|nr:hypothetical protein NPIL_457071 [Nephila pilipes]
MFPSAKSIAIQPWKAFRWSKRTVYLNSLPQSLISWRHLPCTEVACSTLTTAELYCAEIASTVTEIKCNQYASAVNQDV